MLDRGWRCPRDQVAPLEHLRRPRLEARLDAEVVEVDDLTVCEATQGSEVATMRGVGREAGLDDGGGLGARLFINCVEPCVMRLVSLTGLSIPAHARRVRLRRPA